MPEKTKRPRHTTTTIGSRGKPDTKTGGFIGTSDSTGRDGSEGFLSNTSANDQLGPVQQEEESWFDSLFWDPWMEEDQAEFQAPEFATPDAEAAKWGEVQQSTETDLLDENGKLRDFPADAVLFIASGPEDMKRLDQEREAGVLDDNVENLVVLWNPSPAAARLAAESGAFKNVIVSGHGDEGVVYMTNEEGEGTPVSSDDFAEIFAGTAVENVFLNACKGATGPDSVAESLNEVGVNVMAWSQKVKDGDAIEAASVLVELAQTIASGDVNADVIQEAADRFDGPGGNLVARIAERKEAFSEDDDLFFDEWFSWLMFF